MKILLIHAYEFHITSEQEATRPRPGISVISTSNKNPCQNVLIAFTCVEETDSNTTIDRACDEISIIFKKIQGNKKEKEIIKIVPFAHLSNKLMDPVEALRLLNLLYDKLCFEIQTADTVYMGDFGFTNKLALNTHSHNLSCLFRDIQ